MTAPFTVALVQLNSSNDVGENVAAVTALIEQAADAGADFILTPENTAFLDHRTKPLFATIVPEADSEALAAFQALADRLDRWLLIGSIAVLLGPGQAANRSFLIGPDGAIGARYDKIHMFDVDLPGGESYRESKNYRPGGEATVAETPWGGLGMTVCYDLRFPYLYRALAQAGARYLTVPAAFTRQTGKAHWHVLLRSRAIETGSYVFAPAQTGTHVQARETFGHSLIVDPWGEVLADGGEDVGITVADIDPNAVEEARARIPSLLHDREVRLL